FMMTFLEQCPRPPETVSAKYDHWATLSIAGRTGHWVQILRIIVKDRENFSDEFFLNVLYSLWEQYDYLYHGGGEAGNWLAAVSGSVLSGGMTYQEFTDYKNWLDFGKTQFVNNVMRDVHADGKEFENSDKYVAFAYGLLLGNYRALKENGVELPREVHRRMNLGQDWSAWMLQPNGRSFMIGDSAGGVGSGMVMGIGKTFDRPDLVYIATQGKEGGRPSAASRDFPISGWYVMRSDWEDGPFDQARQLVMTAAPYGPHGHQDQLSVSCYAYGRPLLSIPSRLGDVVYATPEHWETIYTRSKNTVVVDGKPQPMGNEPGVKRRCDEMEWFGGKYLDLADAAHPMYEDVVHRRRVLFLKSDYWIVIDDLTPKSGADLQKPHTYDQHFHFKDGTDAIAMKNGVVRSNYKRDGNLMLIPLEPEKLAGSEKTSTPVNYDGAEAPTMHGWKYTLKGAGPQRFVTVLYPYPKGKTPRVSVKALDAPDGVTAIELTTQSGRDVIYVGDAIHSYNYSKSVNARARVFAARLDKRGKPIKVSGLDVEELKAGTYIYSSKDGPAKSIEANPQE
ncbi:MAG: alginate lyase family protein, partial [Armatimonadota bacterium]|nr:alginate lyase family protein [Armatimonadota bacterium]